MAEMPPPLSNLDRLECSTCHKTYEPTAPRNVCDCGRPLFARYALGGVTRDSLLPRRDLWRYLPVLPVASEDRALTLGEGGTPLLRCPAIERTYGVSRVFVKDEAANPTGTFKARGMAVAVSKAKELGLARLAVPSAGNAGSALAAYAAKAGIEALVVAPKDTPLSILQETVLFGARLFLVDGTIAQAGDIVKAACKDTGFFNVATMYEPYRVEGKKTMGYELFEQLGGLPDWVVFPTGGGTGVVGLWKAFQELKELGWTDGAMPKIAFVQAEGCAPIVKAFKEGKEGSDPWKNPATIAPGLRVPKALGDTLVLKAVRESHGTGVAVDDEAMRAAVSEAARLEGIGACYEGGATLAALRQLVQGGTVTRDDTVVLFNTGTPLKNPSPPRHQKLSTVESADEIVEALRGAPA
jgi:threonine synthase